MERYILLLRGINVGGHHKLPMKDLKLELEKLGMHCIATILNSGNAVFEYKKEKIPKIEELISSHLEKVFGFPVPSIVRTQKEIQSASEEDCFDKVDLKRERHQYISFSKNKLKSEIKLPWKSKDESFEILKVNDKEIFSILYLDKGKSVKGMEELEKIFGKDLTTRNLNTVQKLSVIK
ncbi:MAG TPA: DUF1697 domain-containing protein [Leptospiraceae bacterium]|nr:DUF1697 domain-containing protein [Leptospiraceae bacterium]